MTERNDQLSDHIKKLNHLQKSEGLHCATKINDHHINYKNDKIKVKLATQTLSESISTALQFCKQIGIEDFTNIDGTENYYFKVNNCFDILNSKNFLVPFLYKKPNSEKSINFIKIECNNLKQYFLTLKDSSRLLVDSGRKSRF